MIRSTQRLRNHFTSGCRERASSLGFVGVDRGKNLAELLEDLTSLVTEMRGGTPLLASLSHWVLDSTRSTYLFGPLCLRPLMHDDQRLGVPEIELEGGGPTPPTGDDLPVSRALTRVILRRPCQRFTYARAPSCVNCRQ